MTEWREGDNGMAGKWKIPFWEGWEEGVGSGDGGRARIIPEEPTKALPSKVATK